MIESVTELCQEVVYQSSGHRSLVLPNPDLQQPPLGIQGPLSPGSHGSSFPVKYWHGIFSSQQLLAPTHPFPYPVGGCSVYTHQQYRHFSYFVFQKKSCNFTTPKAVPRFLFFHHWARVLITLDLWQHLRVSIPVTFFSWRLLGLHWLQRVYRVPVYNSMTHRLRILAWCANRPLKSSSITMCGTLFTLDHPHPLPSSHPHSLTCVYELSTATALPTSQKSNQPNGRRYLQTELCQELTIQTTNRTHSTQHQTPQQHTIQLKIGGEPEKTPFQKLYKQPTNIWRDAQFH